MALFRVLILALSCIFCLSVVNASLESDIQAAHAEFAAKLAQISQLMATGKILL